MATTTQTPSTTTASMSESPTPASPPKPSPPASRKTILSHLHTLLLRHILSTAHHTDNVLVRLSTLLSNPASTDALLASTSYSLALLHALFSRLLAHRLSSSTPTPTSKPGNPALAAPTSASPAIHFLAQAAAATKAIPPVVDDYRIFVRMWGLAGLYMWARGLAHSPLARTAGTKERWVRRIVWAEIASLAAFQVLENGAYLASKGALAGERWSGAPGKKREVRWWMWSSRWWFVFVALELVRLCVQRVGAASNGSGVVGEEEKRALADGEKEGKLLAEEKRRREWLWWRDLVSNLAYLPMTLHWSVEEGKSVLGDVVVSALGLVAGGVLLVDAWGAAA